MIQKTALMNKGAEGVLEKIKCVESHLPFDIQGFDTDNGLPAESRQFAQKVSKAFNRTKAI
jgi:hypothetical protein